MSLIHFVIVCPLFFKSHNKAVLFVSFVGVAALAYLAHRLVTVGSGDYGYFLPRLLDNHLYYLARGPGVKEYTASFCAGIFEFANPQSLALSLPQLLSGLFGPILGIQLTFILSSAAAGAGIYGCARFAGLNHMPAMISGLLMALSGFLLTRMTIGHLTFFNTGFAPVVAMLMLFAVRAVAKRRMAQAMALGGTASLLATSVVYGGAGVMLPQIAVLVALLVVVCGGFAVRWHQWLLVFGGVSAAALLMSAPKLEAMLAVTGNMPRDLYSLPGVRLSDFPLLILQTLFWVPDTETLNRVLENKQFQIGWHELNYSASPLWLLVVFSGMFMGQRAGLDHVNAARAWLREFPMRSLTAGLILLLPIALNVYTPSWNAVLKATPVLGESTNMLRWLVVYLPVLCLLAGWTWRHLAQVHLAPLLILSIALAGQQNVIHSAQFAQKLNEYDNSLVTGPWQNGDVKAIFSVGAPVKTNKDGSQRLMIGWNYDHLFVTGSSNALCYEPMFGYKLEKLDKRYLRVSTINVPDRNGLLPMKNPSCYVYPQENACQPGAHFTADQFDDLRMLTAYGDLPAKVSTLRGVLNVVAAVTLPLTILAAAVGLVRARRRKTGDDADGVAL